MNKNELARLLRWGEDTEPFDNDEWNWKWFGSLLLPHGCSSWDAYGLYSQWFGELEKLEGAYPNSVNFVRVDEEGTFKGRVRFHVLIGGNRIGTEGRATLSWIDLGGRDALLYSYRPGVFCHFVLEKIQASSDVEIMMDIDDCFWMLPLPPDSRR